MANWMQIVEPESLLYTENIWRGRFCWRLTTM